MAEKKRKLVVDDLNEYQEIGLETGTVVAQKNMAYGDAVQRTAKALKVFLPDGIPPDRYTDALTIVRLFDKISRIATNNDPFGESPWHDIMGYALLRVFHLKQEGEK